MQPIRETRRARLADLVAAHGGQVGLAGKLGKDKNQVYQWLLHVDSKASRNISDSSARAIEAALGLPSGWMDQDDAARLSTDLPTAAAQPLRLDADRLALALTIVDGAIKDSGKRVPDAFRARMIKHVYEDQRNLTADTADTVKSAMAGLLQINETP